MIAIIKYNAGNVASVANALSQLGYQSIITDEPDLILSCDKVIFPGVGEASSAMKYLKERSLDVLIKSLKKPVLGICLGQQLMCAFSEEGNVNCLGIFKTIVKKFPPVDLVPHMGWNNLEKTKGNLFANISKGDFYFVHSYYCDLSENTIATCTYGVEFSAAMQKDNFYATQFHPEKSGDVGFQVLQNFLMI